MITILARQIQFPKMHVRNTTPSEESTVYSFLGPGYLREEEEHKPDS
jgi:hypothetical protein